MPPAGLHDNLRLEVQKLSENLIEFIVNPTRLSPVLVTTLFAWLVKKLMGLNVKIYRCISGAPHSPWQIISSGTLLWKSRSREWRGLGTTLLKNFVVSTLKTCLNEVILRTSLYKKLSCIITLCHFQKLGDIPLDSVQINIIISLLNMGTPLNGLDKAIRLRTPSFVSIENVKKYKTN